MSLLSPKYGLGRPFLPEARETLRIEGRKEPQSQSEERGFTFDQGQAEVSFPHGTYSKLEAETG